jgi:4-amino-4-deoxy-L-arabinose transferase-like glycosyltransferase
MTGKNQINYNCFMEGVNGITVSDKQTARKRGVILVVILCGSALLLFANLGNIYLWQDEAQTALISKTILTDGVPRGYDGKNFFAQEAGAEYGKNYIWRWHTWLPFYVLAGFYKVFGISTFVSRLPFALFGFGTVVMTYLLAKDVWPESRVGLIAAGMLSVCVPFLLLCRQCRYYSMSIFFSVLALYAYIGLINRRKYSGLMLFASSTMLFHALHIYIAPLFAAILLHSIIFHRERLRILFFIILTVVLFNAPWYVWLSGMSYKSPTFCRLKDPTALFEYMRAYVLEILRYVFPVWLPVIIVIAYFTNSIKKGGLLTMSPPFLEKVSLPVFFIVFNILTISMAAEFIYFRYVGPVIPMLILLIAVILNAAAEAHWLLAAAAIIIILVSGQLKDYFYEITHDYDGPEEGIVRYLSECGSPTDTVVITYGDMAIKFYTQMTVNGGLAGDDYKSAINNARWIIIRRDIHTKEDEEVKTYLLKNVEWNRFREIQLDYSEYPWENREDPDYHLFKTCSTSDKVVIFERIK